ncbi:MAG: Gfo/Idh/MocA family oxidoreductase [Bryobacterales bacterium]|nr:Gfo/Idh/MocA family oxidoreductase [Bryobacterales bacterium]
MSEASRRTFLANSATALSASRAWGAAGRIRVGVIGTGGRGQYLMKELLKLGGVDFPAVCDVYDVRRADAARIAGAAAEQYVEYKDVIARKDLDAVIVATPDHWHARIAVDAMHAGKDVYIEKPMVHFPKDGLAIVKAARETRRIVQVGMQGRGLPQFVEAKQKFIDSGAIGKVGLARTWYTSNTGYIQTPPPGMDKKPGGLDWERWTGPGPKVPWNANIFFSPYKWLHYDGGMIMGIGIHVVDSAHHWLGLSRPLSAVSGGGIAYYDDGRDTPDVVTFIVEYPQKVTLTFTAECLSAPGVRTSAGVELRGTGGTLSAERYIQQTGYVYTPNARFSKVPAESGGGTPASAANVLQNWLDCIKSRKKTIANEEEGYWSAMACFLAAQAFRTRTRVNWDPKWDLPA